MMPSMRGIEKPHTSASTAATADRGARARSTRLVVTDDLPTPPLPDATARTRVRESVNGLIRGAGLTGPRTASTTCSGLAGATPLSSRPAAMISSSVMSRRSTSTRSMPGDLADGLDDPPARARPGRRRPGRGGRDRHDRGAPVDGDALHHAQLDDRAAQLGLLDRRQTPAWMSRSLSAMSVGMRRAPADFHYGHR